MRSSSVLFRLHCSTHNTCRVEILPGYRPRVAAHETWFEKLMREASEAGEFDDLPGAGEPIADLDRPYDPEWWARRWMQRETLAEGVREVAARIRREVPRILAGTDEAAMRNALSELNNAVRAANERLPDADRLPSLDVEAMIQERASLRRNS